VSFSYITQRKPPCTSLRGTRRLFCSESGQTGSVPIVVVIIVVIVIIIVVPIVAVVGVVRAGGIPVVLPVPLDGCGRLRGGRRNSRCRGCRRALRRGRSRGRRRALGRGWGRLLRLSGRRRAAQKNRDVVSVFLPQLRFEGCFLPDHPVVVLTRGCDGHRAAPGQVAPLEGLFDQVLHGVVAVLPLKVEVVQQGLAVFVEAPGFQHAVGLA